MAKYYTITFDFCSVRKLFHDLWCNLYLTAQHIYMHVCLQNLEYLDLSYSPMRYGVEHFFAIRVFFSLFIYMCIPVDFGPSMSP